MKKTYVIMVNFLLLCACGSATVTLKDSIISEYGKDLTVETFTDQADIALKEVKNYDAKKIGEQTVTAIFDQAGKEIIQEIKLEVKDTQKPEITLNKEEVEITVGDEYDPKSNIKSIKDPVDGDIKYNDEKDLKKDGYQITGEIKTDTAGTYEQKVIAYDVNGNKSEKSFKVIVKEKEEESMDLSTSTNEETSTTGSTANTNAGSTGGGTAQATGGTNVATGGGEPTPAPQQPSSTPEPTPTPEPAPQPTPEPEPTVLCPNGTYLNKPCDYLITGDGVPGNSGVWTASEEEAIQASHDFSGQWEGYSSYVVETEWNDGRIMYTVVYY